MGTLHSTILLSLLLIKVGPKVTLKGQYRPSVINDDLIQGHSSVFVTWSSLNKSYARNYTLPLDHISLRKQEELFLSLYLIFWNWSSLLKCLFMFLACICPALAQLRMIPAMATCSCPFLDLCLFHPFPQHLFLSLISNCLPTSPFQLYFLPLSVTSSISLFLHLSSCHTSCLLSPPSPVSLSW